MANVARLKTTSVEPSRGQRGLQSQRSVSGKNVEHSELRTAAGRTSTLNVAMTWNECESVAPTAGPSASLRCSIRRGHRQDQVKRTSAARAQ
jgi:hypothetical protein